MNDRLSNNQELQASVHPVVRQKPPSSACGCSAPEQPIRVGKHVRRMTANKHVLMMTALIQGP